MGIFDKLIGKKKDEEAQISSILPKEIFEAGALELKDIIAPSALKISPKEINLGEKIKKFLRHFISSIPL